LFSKLFEKFKLPALLGMLAAGILLGKFTGGFFLKVLPDGFLRNVLEYVFIRPEVLQISPELKKCALIVILIRAGLGINKKILNKVGVHAGLLGFIPCLVEAGFIFAASILFLGFSYIEAGIISFVIAAVSPAVVVPSMLGLKEKGFGSEKEIPTLVLAGSSLDDVFSITVFGIFINLAGTGVSLSGSGIVMELLKIPLSILTGIAAGLILGFILIKIYIKYNTRDTKKAIVFFLISIIFYHIQDVKLFPISALLGVMTIGFVILEKNEEIAHKLSSKFAKIWVLAEVLLFVLIGAEVNISYVLKSGIAGLLIIAIGIGGRSMGVYFSLIKSGLNLKEKLFCVIAYIPKATVQAAIGGIALNLVIAGKINLAGGIKSGDIILAIAVLSIILTAPLGAIGIKIFGPRLLKE
jgi:NhaP-type Na+/H+ or K+/H+ antiporter